MSAQQVLSASEDFDELAHIVDPFIQKSGGLAGLILETAHFRGWKNLDAAARHFPFVSDHHKKIQKVAVVTDKPSGSAAEPRLPPVFFLPKSNIFRLVNSKRQKPGEVHEYILKEA